MSEFSDAVASTTSILPIHHQTGPFLPLPNIHVLPSILPTTSRWALLSTMKMPGRSLLLPPHHHQMAPFLTSQGVGCASVFVFRQDMLIQSHPTTSYNCRFCG